MKRKGFVILLLVSILLIQFFSVDGQIPSKEKISKNNETIDFNNAREMGFYNDYLFVMEWEYGWSVIDVSNPSKPGTRIKLDLYANNHRFKIKGNYLYCSYHNDTENFQEILIYDLINPLEPSFVANISYQSSDSFRYIYPTSDRLYFTSYFDHLYSYDITNPSNPVLLNKTDYSGNEEILYATNNVMYTAETGEIEVWDVENASEPILQKTLSLEYSYPTEMIVVENLGYVTLDRAGSSGDYWGIAHFDMTNEKNPTSLGQYQLDSYEAVAITSKDNDTLYVTGENTYSTYIEVGLSEPGVISDVIRHNTEQDTGFYWDIDFYKGYLFLLNPTHLYIINIDSKGLSVNYFFLLGVFCIIASYQIIRIQRKRRRNK